MKKNDEETRKELTDKMKAMLKMKRRNERRTEDEISSISKISSRIKNERR